MGAVDTFKMMKVLILFTSLVLLILLTWNPFNLSTQVLTPTHVHVHKGKEKNRFNCAPEDFRAPRTSKRAPPWGD